jgi:hypothetical protein
MPFTPWLEHDLNPNSGACVRCGLVPKATYKNDHLKAYTHGEATLTNLPITNIVKCALWVVLSLCLLASPVFAARSVSITWTPNTEPDLAGYKIYYGFMSCASAGPMLPAATIGKVSSYILGNLPDDTTVVSARLTAVDSAGNESPKSACVEQTWAPPISPLEADLTALKADVAKLQAQLAGVCRAAKLMGGSATTLAGRLRKEIPCL